jgi:hypothetical protein
MAYKGCPNLPCQREKDGFLDTQDTSSRRMLQGRNRVETVFTSTSQDDSHPMG